MFGIACSPAFRIQNVKAIMMQDLRGLLRHILENPHFNNATIAEQLMVSKTTVSKYRRLIQEKNIVIDGLEKLSRRDLKTLCRKKETNELIAPDPDWEADMKDIAKGWRRRELWKRYYDGNSGMKRMEYRTYCERIAIHIMRSQPTMKLVHIGGEDMMTDFAGYRPQGLCSTTALPKIFELFVAVMPASQKAFAAVVRSQKTEDWLWANEQALRFFGGVPRYIVCDNLKAAVIRRPRHSPAVINPAFVQFCQHFRCAVKPTRVRHPKDKALVEQAVGEIQRLLRLELEDRPLMFEWQINEHLQRIVSERNAAPFARQSEDTRDGRFDAIDRPALQPLNPEQFKYFHALGARQVPASYHILVEKCQYSVPAKLIGLEVDVRQSRSSIEVFYDGLLVAKHPRSFTQGETITASEHMPVAHKIYKAYASHDIELWASTWSGNVQAIAAMEAIKGLRGAVKSKWFERVTELARAVGQERFENACARAVRVHQLSFGHVRNVLDNHLEDAPLPPDLPSSPPDVPCENIRGAEYYSDGGEAA